MNPQTSSFRLGLGQAITPGDSPIISGLGFDSSGRLHTTNARTCVATDRGFTYRLGQNGQTERSVQLGICPFGLAFADVPEETED